MYYTENDGAKRRLPLTKMLNVLYCCCWLLVQNMLWFIVTRGWARGGAKPGAIAAVACGCSRSRSGVSSGDDVGLDLRVCVVGRQALRHAPFVENPDGTSRIVTSDPENNGSLFLHRLVASARLHPLSRWWRPWPIVHGLQRPRCRVASQEGHGISPALEQGGDKLIGKWMVRWGRNIPTIVHTIFQVRSHLCRSP